MKDYVEEVGGNIRSLQLQCKKKKKKRLSLILFFHRLILLLCRYGGYEGVMYPDLVHLLRYTQRNALTLSEAQEEINQLAAEIRRAAAFAATE